LITARSSLVSFQVFEADDIHRYPIHFLCAPTQVTFREINAVYRREDFQPDRRNTHPHYMPELLEQFRPERRYIETELAQSFHESDAILLVDRDPDIEIAGGARIAVLPDGVSANEQILNPRRAQQP